jgi:deazaflavin-dependent oxidoreductase (nitroreductase family)
MTAFLLRPDAKDWQGEHLRRYLATDGEDGFYVDFHLVGGPELTPTLILTTIGRRSGKAQIVPLIFGQAGKDYVIVASKGGAPQHPAWYLNLVAHADVNIQIKANRMRARARTATGAERAKLWGVMAQIYPPYDEYQKRAGREIPVVVLEPLAS